MIDLYETEKDSGVFERTFSFSDKRSAPNILYALEGDTVTARYSHVTSDEFDDFTFSWNYSKYKGGNPDKFDIIINTPMKRKSNTDVTRAFSPASPVLQAGRLRTLGSVTSSQ